MHTDEQIKAVMDANYEEWNQTMNQLPLDMSKVDIYNKLQSLWGQVVEILKVVIQERKEQHEKAHHYPR